jgi:hypothetical protein
VRAEVVSQFAMVTTQLTVDRGTCIETSTAIVQLMGELGCDPDRPGTIAELGGTDEASAVVPPRQAPIAEAPTQIPACDAYLTRLEQLLLCEEVSPPVRQLFRQTLDALTPALVQAGARPDDPGLAAVMASCANGNRVLAATAADLGCPL